MVTILDVLCSTSISQACCIATFVQSLAELAKRRQSEGLMAVFDTEGARIVQRSTKWNKKQTGSETASVLSQEEQKTDKGEEEQTKLTETAV